MNLSNEQIAHDIAIAVLRFKQDQLLQVNQALSNKHQTKVISDVPKPTEIYLDAYENSLKLLEEKGL